MKVVLDVTDNKVEMFLEFMKSLSFVKKAEVAEPNEILNPRILQSIEDYEKGKATPTPVNLADLKALIDAQS